MAELLENLLAGKLAAVPRRTDSAIGVPATEIVSPQSNLTQRLQSDPKGFEKKGGGWQLLGSITAAIVLVVAVVLAVKNRG